MYYLSKSLSIYTYGQSCCRWYWGVTGAAPGDTDRENLEMHLEAKMKMNSTMHLDAGIERVWGCTSVKYILVTGSL